MNHRLLQEEEEPMMAYTHLHHILTTDLYHGGYNGGNDISRTGFLRMNGNPFSLREAAVREMEKERIRKEIIATEISMSRRAVLEAEVRREMAMERESGLRRTDGLSMVLTPVVPMMVSGGSRLVPKVRYGDGNRRDDWFGVAVGSGEVGGLERESMPFTRMQELREVCTDVGGSETLPVLRRREFQSRITEVEENAGASNGGGQSEKEKQPVILVKPGNTNLVRTKRKAAVELANNGSKKTQDKKEWFCAVCKVYTTGEKLLNEHFSGKKHKAKKKLLSPESKDGGKK